MSVVGYGVKEFYCCNSLTSVKISFSEHAQNHSVKTADKSDCCKTRYAYFKVKDNHFASDLVNSPANFLAEVPAFYSIYQASLFVSPKINIDNPGNAPPLYNGVSLFVANCTYLI
jgi:hypothetical protein